MTNTPMMIQWKALKEKAKDALLLFRLGDFYEAFLEDAKIISKELNLTLTKRQNVPMCGVPYHAFEIYLDKLVSKRFKVAIAEQMQDSKETKGLVRREIARIISPGAIISSNLLKDKSNNFFLSLSQVSTTYGFAALDLSTSEFYVMQIEEEKELLNEIMKIKPSEILISRKFKSQNSTLFEKLSFDLKFLLNEKDDWYFDFEMAHDKLLSHFNFCNLDGFGLRNLNAAIISAGALIYYLKDDLSLNLDHIKTIKKENLSSYMSIDYSTMKNLEILDSFNYFNKESTLLNLLDKTSTPMGGRLLKKWLKLPLLDISKIQKRHNAVDEILKNFEIFFKINSYLENIKDLQRLLMKIINQNATPRDLAHLKFSLTSIPKIKNLLEICSSFYLKKNKEDLQDISPLLNLLEKALVDHPPIRLSDGNIFKKSYSEELDKIKEFSQNSYLWLNKYQNELKDETNIKTLKIKFNKIFGYFIEISKLHADKVSKDFFKKQTLVNTERFITEKLKDFEEKILTAEEKIKSIETKLFNELKEKILAYSNDIEKISLAIAKIDVLLSFAKTAKAHKYTKPKVNVSDVIEIKNGRHPVIEASLSTGEFIANDTFLNNSDNQLLLITGPNMAGKSTYIRQTALIVIMAQIGSYVPAEEATIGLVDKVFSRIGAFDDLTRGQSTFMVEMTETANILNNTTKKSLIILDEIGRGTSTYDGISIAWAVAQYLLTHENKKAKTLFATHYFELTKLKEIFKGVKNYTIEVKETENQVIFLRKIIEGSLDKSYGIHVAKLANMPHFVIQKAKERLHRLEKNKKTKDNSNDNQLLLFDVKEALNQKMQNIIKEIEQLDLNNITPMQALQKIYYLKQKIQK